MLVEGFTNLCRHESRADLLGKKANKHISQNV